MIKKRKSLYRGKRFDWFRGYQGGGRSLMWGRQSYRWNKCDFEANAKDAAIGKFMQVIVTDCYYPKDQKIFMDGLNELQKRCKQKFNKNFIDCSAGGRTELVKQLDAEAKEYNVKKLTYDTERNNKAKGSLNYKKDEMPNHWFTLVKQLTLWGFFTSKVGASKALRYVPVPGKYEGDVEYKKGDRALFPCY